MDIKSLLGDAYSEGMTIEQINSALAEKNFVDTSTLPKSVDKTTFDKIASELAALKKERDAIAAASMSAEEKAKLALEEATLTKSKYAIELSKLRAQEILTKAGLTETEYTPLLANLVSEDEETTKASTTAFVTLLSAQKDAASKAIKEELLKGTPQAPAGGTPPSLPLEYSTDYATFVAQRQKELNQ